MSQTPNPKYTFPTTPEAFGAMLAQAEPSIFFALAASVTEFLSSLIRLVRGTPDEYRITNRNWARTSSTVFRGARSVALLFALLMFIFSSAFAASFFGGIVMVTAAYNLGKAGWSLYKLLSFKEDDPKHKADLMKHFKSNALGAAFAVASAVACFALMMSPVGPAVLMGLAITSSVIGFILLGYTALQFYFTHRKRTTILDKSVDDPINDVKDQEIVDEAVRLSEDHAHQSWHDYQYAVNYPHVVNQISSQKTAQDFLEKELFNYKLELEQQALRHSWLDHRQLKKRQAKLDLVEYYEDFLNKMKEGQIDAALDFNEAFKEHLMPEDDPTNWEKYLKIKNLGTQSFFRHKGRMEDLIRGIGQHYEQTRYGQYGTFPEDTLHETITAAY